MVEQQAVSAPVGAEEEIEGIGSPEDEELGEYPLDTTLVRTSTRTVHDVLRRIRCGDVIMDADFQRDFIWDESMQSKLIESVIMQIPLPVFYIAQNDDGKLVIVDGLQRLSTFQNFVGDGLRLRLPNRPSLDRKRFSDLERKFQIQIEDCNLTLYVIDAKAEERARLDIFERVDGGARLTRQQMRNSLYMGPATRFLKAEAEKRLFRDATGGSLNSGLMQDREFINRFCGFQLFSLDDYRGDMDVFLSDTLKRMDTSNLEDLSSQLRAGLSNNLELFGRYAFRKHTSAQKGRRSLINASLWDVMCTGLARYNEETVKAHKDKLLPAFYNLLKDQGFNDAITLGTNQTKRVKRRFEMANAMFRKVFGD